MTAVVQRTPHPVPLDWEALWAGLAMARLRGWSPVRGLRLSTQLVLRETLNVGASPEQCPLFQVENRVNFHV